jgi:hypothetical protein
MTTPVDSREKSPEAPKDAASTATRGPSPFMTVTKKALTESSAFFESASSTRSEVKTFLSGASISSSGFDLKGLEAFFELRTYDHETDVKTPLEALPKHFLDSLPFIPKDLTKTKISWSDPTITTIPLPSDKGMLLALSYYQHKYGVPIILAATSRSIKQAILAPPFDINVRTWGVIVTTSSLKAPHVTPLLIHRDRLWQHLIFDLDSANFTLPHLKVLLQGFITKKLAIKVFKILHPRQADPFSCRTDSLIILKDALVDICLKEPDEMLSFMDVKEEAPFDIYSGTFELPSAWAKTVQVSSALPKDLTALVNNKHEQSLADFRTRFVQKFSKEELYSMTASLNDGRDIEHSITLRSRYNINTYLN